MTRDAARIELWWLPLGADGWFVRLNGHVYEAVHALRERRRPLDLYHSALVVQVPEGRFVVENCWPIPDGEGARARGVAVEGPVASERIGRFRAFRYEVRCWRDGTIADAAAAVASPQVVSRDPVRARRLLELVGELPRPVWGARRARDRGDVELQLGDRLAARPGRAGGRRDPAAGGRAGPGMGGRGGRGPSPAGTPPVRPRPTTPRPRARAGVPEPRPGHEPALRTPDPGHEGPVPAHAGSHGRA